MNVNLFMVSLCLSSFVFGAAEQPMTAIYAGIAAYNIGRFIEALVLNLRS